MRNKLEEILMTDFKNPLRSIPKSVLDNDNLSYKAKIYYGFLLSLSDNEHFVHLKRSLISKKLGITTRQIDRYHRILEKNKVIKKEFGSIKMLETDLSEESYKVKKKCAQNEKSKLILLPAFERVRKRLSNNAYTLFLEIFKILLEEHEEDPKISFSFSSLSKKTGMLESKIKKSIQELENNDLVSTTNPLIITEFSINEFTK